MLRRGVRAPHIRRACGRDTARNELAFCRVDPQQTMEVTMADLAHHTHHHAGMDFRRSETRDDVPLRVFVAAAFGMAFVMLALVYAMSGPAPEAMFDPNVLAPLPVLPIVPLL
jgi:hypothetical protein